VKPTSNINSRGQPSYFWNRHGFFFFFGCPVENKIFVVKPQRTAGTRKTGKKT